MRVHGAAITLLGHGLGWQMLVAACVVVALLLTADLLAQKREPKPMAFADGFRAYKQKDWEETADRMLASLEASPEDGELIRVYGRWFEPYLPRYYLGVALYQLGCYADAQDQLGESILGNGEVKGAKKQLQELESLKLKAERFVRQGVNEVEDVDCARWHLVVEQPEEESDE